MPTKKTKQEVADIIEMEGLGYAITDYLDADNIEDEELSILWGRADAAMKLIMRKLEEYLP